MINLPDMPRGITRTKSPARLVRDAALQKWVPSSDERGAHLAEYPKGMVDTICYRSKASRPRVYRWLKEPDRHPLEWSELCEVAHELGCNLKCMLSFLK